MQTLKIILLALLVVVLLIICVSYFLFYFGIVRIRSKKGFMPTPQLEPYSEQIKAGIDWFTSQPLERVEISGYDNTKLVGMYLPHENAKGTIILFHGYRSPDYRDYSCVYEHYYNMGYSLLSVFQRAHGESGGSYICFGVKERYDCRDWARYVRDRFGKEHDIFMSGVSMGCTTVLMATGLELPDNVRAITADCGFTSPHEEFKEILKNRIHLPEHPFMDVADFFCKLMAGFGFREYSTLDAMESNSIPILFIHGEKDSFVPTRFSYENYAACKAEKKLISVPDAAHGMSFLMAPELIISEVRDFFAKYSTIVHELPNEEEGSVEELFESSET